MLDLEWIVVFLLLGSFIGFMAGLLGVGGGGLMVPLLTAIFLQQGVPVDNVVHLALGTSMAAMIVTTFSSFRAHNAKQAVLWPVVYRMALGVILGTFSATFLAAYLSSLFLAIFFALFMAFVSLKMFLNIKPKPSREIAGKVALLLAGTGIGVVSALVSIGGGSLTVPYLSWHNVDIKKAIGTSAAMGLPISIAGTLGYLINGWAYTDLHNLKIGFVYVPAVVLISLASFFTAPYGVKLAHSLPVDKLKKVFACVLILLSIKMLTSIV